MIPIQALSQKKAETLSFTIEDRIRYREKESVFGRRFLRRGIV